jgi:hypothetical protein
MICPYKGVKNMKTNLIVVSILMCLLIGCNNTQKPSESSTPENTVTAEENKTTSETFKMEDFVLQVGSKDITVNHEALILNAPFVEIDGHSYIPLRFFLDWFGAESIAYDAKTEKISFSMKRGSYEMESYTLQVGSKDIKVNNEALTLNAPIVEIDGHSYLPLRFFLNRFSAENIAYDEKTEKVSFSMKRYGLLGSDVKNKYRRKEPHEVVKKVVLPKKVETPAVVKEPVKKDEIVSNEEMKSLLLNILKDSYKDFATCSIDEENKAFTITPFDDHYATFAVLAKQGNVEMKKIWEESLEKYKLLSIEIYKMMPGYHIVVYNPASTDRVLIAVMNGVVFIDAVNDP